MRAEGDELLAHLREEITELRAIHDARGTYYDEGTMQQLHNLADAPPRRPALGVYMISEDAKRELRLLIDALDAGLESEAQRGYTRRMREILAGIA